MTQYKTVAELLESPERWTKGAEARDKDDVDCGQYCPWACKWDLVGALVWIYDDTVTRNRMIAKLMSLLQFWHPRFLVEWNDAPERTHAEVLELVRKAGI